LVRSGYELIDGDDNIIGKKYLLSSRKITCPPLTFYEQLKGPKTSFPAFAVKKTIWERVGGFPEELSLSEDWGFWIRISPFGNIVYEHEVISQYRVNYRPDLEKSRFLQETLDHITIYGKIIPEVSKTFDEVNYSKIKQAEIYVYKQRISKASQLFAGEERKELIEIFKEWGLRVGCEKDFQDFLNNKRIVFKDGFSSIINSKLVRGIYAKYRSIV
jgi:hypothetical protein